MVSVVIAHRTITTDKLTAAIFTVWLLVMKCSGPTSISIVPLDDDSIGSDKDGGVVVVGRDVCPVVLVTVCIT